MCIFCLDMSNLDMLENLRSQIRFDIAGIAEQNAPQFWTITTHV